MRNVASRHTQNDNDDDDDVEEEENKHRVWHKWCSLPTINMPEREEHKSNGEEVHNNEEEGLQEVSFFIVCYWWAN